MKERQKLALAGRRMRQEERSVGRKADLFTAAAGDQPDD